MARRRYISTEISTDARVNQLSDFGALLYTWMVPHADDLGGITGDPMELKFLVVPGRTRHKVAAITEAVEAMLQLGLLEREGGRLFFPAEPFYKYQSYITAGRRIRPQTSETAVRRGTPQIATPSSVSVSVSSSLPNGKDPPSNRVRAPVQADMEAIEQRLSEFADLHPRLNVPAEFQEFQNGLKSKARKYADFTAAFRTWLSKEEKYLDDRIQKAGPRNAAAGPRPALSRGAEVKAQLARDSV